MVAQRNLQNKSRLEIIQAVFFVSLHQYYNSIDNDL